MKFKALVTLLMVMGMSNAIEESGAEKGLSKVKEAIVYSTDYYVRMEHYSLENNDVAKELNVKEQRLYGECVNWDQSSCRQAHDALIAFLMQVYPELSQNDLKAIAHEKERRISGLNEIIRLVRREVGNVAVQIFEADKAYEERELGRVEAHIK